MKSSEYIQKGWCQGAIARSSGGLYCGANSPLAVQWCLYGAIARAYPEDSQARSTIVGKIVKILKGHTPSVWNDHPKRTQGEVVELLQSIGE